MEQKVSKSVIRRLPIYLSYLKALPDDAPENISATTLATALCMGEVQVRKDLALVSDGGRPKVGYRRESLVADIPAPPAPAPAAPDMGGMGGMY